MQSLNDLLVDEVVITGSTINNSNKLFNRDITKLLLEEEFNPESIAGATGIGIVEIITETLPVNLPENIWTGLMCACFHGCTNLIKLLLFSKADASTRDSNGLTALLICCIYNQYDSLKILIEYRGDFNDGHAIDIDAVDNNGCTGLIHACTNGNVNIIELLLAFNADTCIKDFVGRTALIISCLKNNNDSLKMIIKHNKSSYGADNHELIHACMNGFVDRVEILLSNKADTGIQNNEGRTALMICCQCNQLESLKLILKHRNESIDGAGIDINAVDIYGCTGLMLACLFKETLYLPRNGIRFYIEVLDVYALEIVDLLLSSNADPTIISYFNKNALTLSAEELNFDVIERLLIHSRNLSKPYFDINNIDQHGNTLLINACLYSDVKLIEILLSLKADPGINGKRNNAVLVCCKYGRYPILDLLLVTYKENSPELNIDAYDDDERTGLMWICLNLTRERLEYSLDGIKLLLDANASPNASDKEDRTPLSVSTNYDKVQEMFTSNVT
jgi:ankyrin repeat protein